MYLPTYKHIEIVMERKRFGVGMDDKSKLPRERKY
jgi:hypothetical protein